MGKYCAKRELEAYLMTRQYLKKRRTIVLALILSAVNPTRFVAADSQSGNRSIWKTIVVGRQSEAERLATVDLQRYLAQVTGIVPVVVDAEQWKNKPCPAVVVGMPQNNVLLTPMQAEPETLGEQGYYLARQKNEEIEQIVALGHTPIGAVNAIYGLLRELGYGFYLGSEAIPASLPEGVLAKPITRKPALATRGVLPWYNFFNSPTTWDPVDHRAFVDQLIRMGANFVGFHTYDHEPFAAYEEDGRMKWGKRLINTSSPTWGTNPLATRDFAFGIDKLFADDFFGAASTPENASTASGRRWPLISIERTAELNSAISPDVNLILSAPLFSIMWAMTVVPGIGTIQGF